MFQIANQRLVYLGRSTKNGNQLEVVIVFVQILVYIRLVIYVERVNVFDS